MGRLNDYPLNIIKEPMVKRVKSTGLSTIRQELLESQEYKCGICEIDLKEEHGTNQHVDHHHETGMIRGVLCQKCNLLEGTMLYRFRRSGHVARGTDYIKWVEQLLEYLKKPYTEYEHPSHMSQKWKKFKNLNKDIQLKELTILGIVPEGKVTKKDLLKMYKKALKR